MLKAVIFDLDGTITELTLPLEAMRTDTKKFFIEKGLPAELLEPADGISSTKHKARTFFEDNGLSDEVWTQWAEELDAVLNSHETDAARDSRLLDGSLDAVSRIRKLGLKTAILTNNGRPAVDIIMSNFPLANYFDKIVTRTEAPSPKPYPEGLRFVTEQLGVDLSEAIYIGDANIDGVAAGRAGLLFWGVTTGETDRDRLIEAGAEMVHESLDSVYRAVTDQLGS
ncbi:MAG: HAD family hydrolase [Candidatus Thorarchaeota archaeon]